MTVVKIWNTTESGLLSITMPTIRITHTGINKLFKNPKPVIGSKLSSDLKNLVFDAKMITEVKKVTGFLTGSTATTYKDNLLKMFREAGTNRDAPMITLHIDTQNETYTDGWDYTGANVGRIRGYVMDYNIDETATDEDTPSYNVTFTFVVGSKR